MEGHCAQARSGDGLDGTVTRKVGQSDGFRIYFKGRANSVCRFRGRGVAEKEVGNDSKLFILSNWQVGVSFTEQTGRRRS